MAKTNKNLEQYFKLPTKRVAIDNTYSKNSPKVDVSDDKAMVDRLLREKSIEAQRSKEKRIADVRRLEELNKKPMLETANPKDLYDIGEGMKSKYRFSNEDNFFDDYINPFNMVGGIAGGLAQTPELINQGEYGNAALNVGLPLGVGALSGIGAQNIGQFTNNLVNPLAGSGDLVNNLGNKYLPNTYKLNPLAKKAENFNNPNSFYRQVDDETFKEGLESGLIKGKQNVDKTNGENLINLNKSFGDDAYYKKGSLYSPQRADYIYEVNKGEDFFTPKVNGRTRKYTTENTPIRVSREPIPLTESNIYQKDWLQGYKLLKFESGGEMQPLNFRDFFGNGGKKTLPPIYVDNRNDPRLRKYQDSLTMYNFGENDYRRLLSTLQYKTTLSEKNNLIIPTRRDANIFGIQPIETRKIGSEFAENSQAGGGAYGLVNRFKKPIQPIIYQKTPPPPKNTNFTVPNNGGYSTPDDYTEPVAEQMPIQEVPVKQDFRQYMQPNGYSRQGQGSERQSESFYDANGKMTGQIIGGQYVPTEYGKFLQSGMTEDEYLNSVQEFSSGGEFSNGGRYDAVINAAEQKYRLPAGLLHGVARTESQYNPNAYNKKSKAAGMFQFIPGTAREFGIDPYDVNQAADAAGKYLSQLIKQTGSVEDALRAYNFGIGNVQKWKQGKKQMPLETQQYVGKVLGGNSVPSIGGGLGKYFSQIEQDLSWRSREIDQELEDEEIPQYSQEEAVADNVEEEDEETTTEEQSQSVQDEYLPLDELSKLMTASRRNDFLDIVFANTAPSIEEDVYQYYS